MLGPLFNELETTSEALIYTYNSIQDTIAGKDHTIEELKMKLQAAKRGKVTHLIAKMMRSKSYKSKKFIQRMLSKREKRKLRRKD